jgi:hypothetical protein
MNRTGEDALAPQAKLGLTQQSVSVDIGSPSPPESLVDNFSSASSYPIVVLTPV